MLYQVVTAWPTRIADWVREAPGRTPHEVTAHVLRRWHEIRDAVGDDPEPFVDCDERRQDAELLRSIVQRLAIR